MCGDCFWILQRIFTFPISWCFLTPSNSQQSNRFLVTVVHQGTCEGLVIRVMLLLRKHQQINREDGKLLLRKGTSPGKKPFIFAFSFTSSNMEKTQTHRNSKKKHLELQQRSNMLRESPPQKKSTKIILIYLDNVVNGCGSDQAYPRHPPSPHQHGLSVVLGPYPATSQQAPQGFRW